jgi:hypothetical protein
MRFSQALLLCVFGFSQMSWAVPIVQTAACENAPMATCATGVTGVDVLGSFYDVVFSQGTYDELFSINDPAFLDDIPRAEVAAAALAGVLNGAGVSGLIGNPSGELPSFVFIPYLVEPFFIEAPFLAYIQGNDFRTDTDVFLGVTPQFDPSDNNPQAYDAYAVFTPSGVPAPPVLALFGLGLVGIGLSRRKRSHPV